jgi:hypothetical protein
MVFTEFLDMVESAYSADFVDDLIDACELPSGGAYTSVGTYDHREIVTLVTALSARTGVPVPDLVRRFGGWLFGRFHELYPDYFTRAPTLFDLLDSVEHYIHREVAKLYPDAQLPRFDTERPDAATLVMLYRSPRGMEDLAEGLIRAAIEHYAEPVELQRDGGGDAAQRGVRFVLRRAA